MFGGLLTNVIFSISDSVIRFMWKNNKSTREKLIGSDWIKFYLFDLSRSRYSANNTCLFSSDHLLIWWRAFLCSCLPLVEVFTPTLLGISVVGCLSQMTRPVPHHSINHPGSPSNLCVWDLYFEEQTPIWTP